MRIANEAPELRRLRRAMHIRWTEYRPWIDNSLDTIRALETEAMADEDESITPLIRAQFIYEMWWTWS